MCSNGSIVTPNMTFSSKICKQAGPYIMSGEVLYAGRGVGEGHCNDEVEAYLDIPIPFPIHPRRKHVARLGSSLRLVLEGFTRFWDSQGSDIFRNYGTTDLRHVGVGWGKVLRSPSLPTKLPFCIFLLRKPPKTFERPRRTRGGSWEGELGSTCRGQVVIMKIRARMYRMGS